MQANDNMKSKLFAKGGIAALMALSFTLGACKKGDDSGNGGGKEADTPPPAGSGGGSEPAGGSTPPEPASTGSGSVAEQVTGYWAPDKESLLATAKKEAESTPDGEAMLAMATAMIEMMIDKAALHMENGNSVFVAPGESDKGSYKLTSTDEATGKFTIEITDAEGQTESGEGTITGDTMTLTKDGEPIQMYRITKEEFDKRKAAAADFQAPGGLPGVVPGADTPPGGAGPAPGTPGGLPEGFTIPDVEIPDVPTPDAPE